MLRAAIERLDTLLAALSRQGAEGREEEEDRALAIHNARAKSELLTMSRLKGVGIRAIVAQVQTELLEEECA